MTNRFRNLRAWALALFVAAVPVFLADFFFLSDLGWWDDSGCHAQLTRWCIWEGNYAQWWLFWDLGAALAIAVLLLLVASFVSPSFNSPETER